MLQSQAGHSKEQEHLAASSGLQSTYRTGGNRRRQSPNAGGSWVEAQRPYLDHANGSNPAIPDNGPCLLSLSTPRQCTSCWTVYQHHQPTAAWRLSWHYYASQIFLYLLLPVTSSNLICLNSSAWARVAELNSDSDTHSLCRTKFWIPSFND